MNKTISNSTIKTVQSFNKQNAPKTKTLIANLGTATQLTLGGAGSGFESQQYRYYNVQH